MSELKYNFVDNNFFTVYTPSEISSIKPNLPILDDLSNDFSWIDKISSSGAPIVKNNLQEQEDSLSPPSKLIVNNNDEVEMIPYNIDISNNKPKNNYSSMNKSISNRVKYAIDFFKDKFINELNLDKEIANRSAKAIVGNFMVESGDPTLNKTDNIGDKNLGPKNSAYGMGLWRLDRRTALMNFAAKLGKPMSDFETLLEFAWDEIVKGLKLYKILEGLVNAKNLREATEAFMNTFERPSRNPKINLINTRIKYAESL